MEKKLYFRLIRSYETDPKISRADLVRTIVIPETGII